MPHGIVRLQSYGMPPCGLKPVIERVARHAYPELWLHDILLTDDDAAFIAQTCQMTLKSVRVPTHAAACMFLKHATALSNLEVWMPAIMQIEEGWDALQAGLRESQTLKSLTLGSVPTHAVGSVLASVPASVTSLHFFLTGMFPDGPLPVSRLERLTLSVGVASLRALMRYAQKCDKLREISITDPRTSLTAEDVRDCILGATAPFVLALYSATFDRDAWHTALTGTSLSQLRALSLRDCTVPATAMIAAVTSKCEFLESLDVSKTRLTGADLSDLILKIGNGYLPNLVCLNMSGNAITRPVLQAIARRLPNHVRVLAIADSTRGSLDTAPIAVQQFERWLSEATHLRALDVSGATFSVEETKRLVNIIPPLEYVKIRYVPQRSTAMLAHLYALPRMINVAETDNVNRDEPGVLVPLSGAQPWERWSPAGHMRMLPDMRKTIEILACLCARRIPVEIVRDMLQHVVFVVPSPQTLLAPLPVF